MNHPNEDVLLQFVLETVGEAERSRIQEHLAGCAHCRAVEGKLRHEVERIASVDIKVDVPRVLRLPRESEPTFRRWAWVAALAAGFLIGLLTARLGENTHPAAVSQRLVTQQASSKVPGYNSCRAVDLQTVLSPH